MVREASLSSQQLCLDQSKREFSCELRWLPKSCSQMSQMRERGREQKMIQEVLTMENNLGMYKFMRVSFKYLNWYTGICA